MHAHSRATGPAAPLRARPPGSTAPPRAGAGERRRTASAGGPVLAAPTAYTAGMVDTPAAPPRPARVADALRWSAAFAFLGAAAGALLSALADGWTSAAQVALVAALAAVPMGACGAAFGLLRTPRSRLVALWTLPGVVLASGALFIYLVLWPQSDNGGLATAGVALFTMLVAIAAAAVALLYTLVRRAPPARQRRVLAAVGAAMALAAVAARLGAPSPEERGWVPVPEDLRSLEAAAPAADASLDAPGPRGRGEADAESAAEAQPPAAATGEDPGAGAGADAATPPVVDDVAEVDCRDDEPPLFVAIRAGDLPRVRALVAKGGVSANLYCDHGEGTGAYPLELALVQSNVAMADALLDAGADPSLAAEGSASPLHLAAGLGAERLVRRLLALGADPDAELSGVPLLYEAAGTVHAGIVRALLDAGASPDASFVGKTALHHAAEGNAPEVVKALVDGGADLDARSASGLPPAGMAARAGKAANVEVLLAAGGRDATWAALGALQGGHLELARALARRGVDVEHHHAGCDVLVLAAEHGDVPLVEAILGASARVREECLREALQAAGRGRDADALVALLSRLR